MSNEVFDKVKRLPADKQQEVEDFINFLVGKYLAQSDNVEAIANKRRLNMGRLHGQIQISDDFNKLLKTLKIISNGSAFGYPDNYLKKMSKGTLLLPA